MILAFAGELVLVAALLFLVVQVFGSGGSAKYPRLVMTLALLFIAVTASLGALRYLGEQDLVPLHDLMSYGSRFIAMPLYACAALVLWGRLPMMMAAVLLVVAMLPLLGLPAMITDAVLVLCLLRLVQQAQLKLVMSLSLLSLLLVPLCSLLIKDRDLAMGLFHLCLASHFFCLALALRGQHFLMLKNP